MGTIARVQADSRTRRTGIPLAALLAGGAPGPRTGAGAALGAIAAGLQEAGWPEPDICVLGPGEGSPRELLEAHGVRDADAPRAGAGGGDGRLSAGTLAGSLTFEMATRARQGGVPAYAVTGENDLDPFGARILDLQLIVQARIAGRASRRRAQARRGPLRAHGWQPGHQ